MLRSVPEEISSARTSVVGLLFLSVFAGCGRLAERQELVVTVCDILDFFTSRGGGS